MLFQFDNSYARELPGFYERVQPDASPSPQLLIFNEALTAELGLDPERLRPRIAKIVGGNEVPEGAEPLAQVYAGHQFGHFAGRLGDGRALLLGEVIDAKGRRKDIHFKGSGATPFSRGGDGKATVGPVLREYLMGEAMHALGIPTTRGLAAVSTGEMVLRDQPLQGAVLARVASSHLRVGTFEYFAATGEREKLARLVDYALARHYPEVERTSCPALALLRAVVQVQAKLIAKWLGVGFIHGVMNTDNMTISGETIDYGPCAFMDRYDPRTVFSSIDRHGRYAFGNQPAIGQWNLLRLGVALAPLIAANDEELKKELDPVISEYARLFEQAHLEVMRRKLGLDGSRNEDKELVDALLLQLEGNQLDYTQAFRQLADALRALDEAAPRGLEAWWPRYLERLAGQDLRLTANRMDTTNPVYIPRNHKVEEALALAREGEMREFERLLELLSSPYVGKEGTEAYAQPAPEDFYPYQTFCGT